jgi:hypothetical protein
MSGWTDVAFVGFIVVEETAEERWRGTGGLGGRIMRASLGSSVLIRALQQASWTLH